MRLTSNLGVLTIGTIIIGCAIMPPRRQYDKETKRQIISKELLNSQWTLETFDNKKPDCNLLINFYDQGRFTFTLQGHLFEGDYLYYVVKDSIIQFHTRPVDKFAWPTFDCELKPDKLARHLSWGYKRFKIVDDKLFLGNSDRTDFFVFKRT